MLFQDRIDAGRRLALRLQQLIHEDCLVLAVPRGGIVVGYEVASFLDAPLDVICPRKLGAPSQPELAIGAVSPWGRVSIVDETTIGLLRVPPEYIEKEKQEQFQEADRRLIAYRGSTDPPNLEGKTALLVDDGIATGYTMLAAVKDVQTLKPASIVVAAPMASEDAAARIAGEVSEFVCLEIPSPFLAVGYWYHDFRQVTDEEVVELLDRRNRPHSERMAS